MMQLKNLKVHLAKQVRPPHSPGLHVSRQEIPVEVANFVAVAAV